MNFPNPKQPMSPEEKLQGLLRLKQHEKPPADYFENFLDEFHQRQRESLMRQGAFSLFWERFSTWASCLRRPAVVWSAAAAYAAIILLICVWPKPGPSPTSGAVLLTQQPATNLAPAPPTIPALPAPPIPRGVVPVSNNPQEILQPTGSKPKNVEDLLPEAALPPPGERTRDL